MSGGRGWLTDDVSGVVHVVPIADLIEHNEHECCCGPTTEPVPRDDGTYGWVEIHHSLDGREKTEGLP